MKKAAHHISNFLLLLSVLIINLHLIVPHDHHRDILNPDLKHSCPVQENRNGHTKFPEHCSMLNDMSNVLAFEASFGHFQDLICIIPDTISVIAEIPYTVSQPIPFKFPDKQVFADSKLLRAPPVNI
jgi:hypothetical protein